MSQAKLFSSSLCSMLCAVIAAAQVQIVPGTFVESQADCLGTNNVLYELHPGMTFDLDNRSIEIQPNGLGSYITFDIGPAQISPFGAASPTSVQISLNDDEVSSPRSLGFSFPYPMDSTQSGLSSGVEISSNGYVYLQPGTVPFSRCCDGEQALASFLDDGPSFALFGADLDPSASGTVWFDARPSPAGGVCTITFDRVTGPNGTNSTQIELDATGRVVLTWFGISGVAVDDSSLIGWSGGLGQPDLGPINLSAPFNDGGIGDALAPLRISADDPPIVNHPFRLEVDGVPDTALAAAVLFGTVPTLLDLGVIGAPGCGLFTNGDIGIVPVMVGAINSGIDLGVLPPGAGMPNDGLVIHTQIIALVPGASTVGLVTSNRGTMTIGTDTTALPGLVVRLEGVRTDYCADPPGGAFWSVRNNSTTGESIQSVTFDLWSGGMQVNQGAALFDTDGNRAIFSSIGDFSSGNSSFTTGVCPRLNAFRGSDFSTGLVYAGTPATPCDPASQTGWIGTNPLNGEFGTLTFQFSNFTVGKKFEFDLVVAGGPIGADGLNEVLVTVQTDQRTVVGQLTVVDADTAIVAF